MNTPQDFNNLPPVLPLKTHVTSLNARTLTKVLDVSFDDGKSFSLSFELMRVYSPSAEVRGHGVGQATLQLGKRLVNITGIEPVGNYAIKPIFDDGHSSGLFTWEYLYWLGTYQDLLWKDYISRLQTDGFPEETGRDQDSTVKTTKNCHN
jgi:DUF971 family protein